MEKRFIKDSNVSLLGMGCMRFPLIEGTEEIDLEQTEKMVDLAFKSGINYFDTAYPYHFGKSETVIGNILSKYPRESFYLADKMPSWSCQSKEDVVRIFNEQLEKCKVEYFDFYLCHAMNFDRIEEYKKYDAFNFLAEMRRQGKIKKLGFSFHDAAQNILPIIEQLDWDFAQIQLNYLDYDMQDAKKQYELLTENNISVVVMEPVRGGMLANVCDEAKELFTTARPDKSIASWALRYVASFPNVKVILSGMSNLEQLQDNINTFTNYEELTDNDKEVIQKAKKAILGNNFIPCTGCSYCMPCPMGINIPRTFAVYNLYGINKDLERFKNNMSKNGVALDACVKCGACLEQCPQKIDIPTKLEDINKI